MGNPQLLRVLHLHGSTAVCVKHKRFRAGAMSIDQHILTKAVSACVWLGRFLRNNIMAQITMLHLI